jgi:hypothetical protein
MPGVTNGVVFYLEWRPETPPTPPTDPYAASIIPDVSGHNWYDQYTPFDSNWDHDEMSFTSKNPSGGTFTFNESLSGDDFAGKDHAQLASRNISKDGDPGFAPYALANDVCTLTIPFSSIDADINAWEFVGGVQVKFYMKIYDTGNTEQGSGFFIARLEGTQAQGWKTVDFSISEATGAACFLGPTKVKTDQGLIAFNQLTKYNTISNLKIKKVTKMYNSDDNLIFIKKHAFGKNIPNKNTYIGRNHAIYIDGKLVRARDLINKNSVQQHPRQVSDMIYNVLLEKYSVMYINNMPCETLNENDPAMLKYIK